MLTMPAPKSRSTVLVLARELAAKDMYLAQTADGDLVLGKDELQWRHGWVPLNAVAASIKAKKWKGHGGEKPKVASVASSRGSAGKSRIDIERTMRGGGPSRSKTRSTKPTGLEDKYAAARETLARRKREGTTPDQIAQEVRLGPNRARPAAKTQIREHTYRGQQGHAITGTDTHGRKVQVFVPGSRGEAEKARGRIHAGQGPFETPDETAKRLGVEFVKPHIKSHAVVGEGAKVEKPVKTDQQKLDTLARKYGRDNAYTHPNGRQYFVNKQSPFSHPSDPHVGYSVEGQSGEHLGRVSVREGKLHIAHFGRKGDNQHEELGSVETPKQAVHGLVAARYLQDQKEAERKAADAAAIRRGQERIQAQRTEAQKAVEAAKAEKERRSEDAYRRAAEANRRRLFSPAPKSKATKSDTPTMQKTREALGKTLDQRATDITKGVHPDTLRHGQVVTFRTPDTYTHKLPPHSEATDVGMVHSGGGYGQHTLFNRRTVKDDHHLYRIEPKHLSGGEGRSLDIHVDQSGDVRGAKLVGYKNGIFAQPEHVDPSELHKMAPELFHPPQSGGSVRYKHVGRQMETTKHPGQTRTGHIVHTGWGQTSVHSMNPETGKSEYFTSHHGGGQRARVGNDFAKSENDPEALVHARQSFQGIHRGHTPDTAKGSVSEMLRRADAEYQRRHPAKPGKPKNYVGMSYAELTKLVAKGEPGAIAEQERRGRNANRRRMMGN